VAPDEQNPPAAPDAPAGAPPPAAKPSLLQLVRRAPVASLIIAINVIVFALASRTGSTTQNDTLIRFGAVWRPLVWQGEYWRLATAMFLHIGVVHLLANAYFGFGMSAQVEQAMGRWRFLALYLLSGIAGGLLSFATPRVAIIGASGAICGLMLAAAWFWPRQQLLFWGIIPIELRWLVVGYTVISLFGASSPQSGGVAYFAHLGGFIGSWLYLRWMELHSGSAVWKRKLAAAARPPKGSGDAMDRWKRINPETLHPVNREEYERVMAKLAASGLGSLTPPEREFLDRFSQVT
jgi:membrane associated rhomboid family serine protease